MSSSHIFRAVRARFADEAEIDAAQAQAELRRAGTAMVSEVRDRTRVSLTGIISSVLVQPAGTAPVLEAELYDGSGTITLIWLGREGIAGIEPGARLRVHGLATVRGHRRRMHNPRYDIIAVSREEEG